MSGCLFNECKTGNQTDQSKSPYPMTSAITTSTASCVCWRVSNIQKLCCAQNNRCFFSFLRSLLVSVSVCVWVEPLAGCEALLMALHLSTVVLGSTSCLFGMCLFSEHNTFLGRKAYTLEFDNITWTQEHTSKRKSAECLATVVAGIHGQTHPLLHKEQTATIVHVGHWMGIYRPTLKAS